MTLGAAAESLGAKIAADEVDLSSGELAVPEATAATVQEGGELALKVRLPGLAEGALKVRKRGPAFSTVGAEHAILLRHPALARFAATTPTVLVLDVKENKVGGWVGLGMPGPVKGSKRSLLDAMTKGADLLGWAGLSKITFPSIRNRFEGGVIDVGVENLNFTVGGFLSGAGSVALDNKALSFEGSAKIQIPGGSGGELLIKKDPTGALSGKLDILVQIGSVAGTVAATLSRGFVSVMGSVAYSGDRLSGKVTLAATDEATARDITLKKPSAGGDVPIELPGPDKPATPGKRAFCGWGQLNFRVTDWLAGTATVIVNSKGQATIVGEIAPPKEFILFEQKEWIKKLFKVEIRAGYGIPVVGQVGLFANIGLDALAKVGPGKLYNIKLAGAYSTDPRVTKQLSIEGTLNISAFAGLRLRAEAGLVVTILGHDIKAGVGLNAIAGVRGYVEATPRIGMRELAPGKPQYYIQGHLEIAAQPVLGFSGDLFVAIETPWWSPLSDKRWTWPLFSIEYPLPGEFGIGADVDYVLGSKQWPKIEFGEVNFDASKFMTDVMNDNTDSGSGGETKKPGDWKEGAGGKGPGGAKNKGGGGKKPGELDDDLGPVGEEESFSDGAETHRIWFEQKGQTATLMMASGSGSRVERKLEAYEKSIDLLYPAKRTDARALIAKVRSQLGMLDDEATQLAAMKLAARKAKEVYEKNKDKPRKKAGQKKGKDGGKDLAKKVKKDEQTLRDPLSKMALLLLDVPFKPIKRQAEMADGKTESLQVVDRKVHAGLQVAGKPEGEKLSEVLAAVPLKTKAVSSSGLDLVTGSAKRLATVVKTLTEAPAKAGRINAKVLESLEKPADKATTIISDIGRRMGIPNLERARQFRPIDAQKLEPLRFKPHPASPDPSAKLYVEPFVRELERQVRDQQRGINELSVDQWTTNLAKFSVDERAFKALDAKGREHVLKTLLDRTKTAKTRTTKSLAQTNKAIANLTKQIPLTAEQEEKMEKLVVKKGRALQRRDAIALAEQEIAKAQQDDKVTPSAEILKPKFAGTDEEMGLKIRSRQGAETKVRKKIPKEDLEKLLDQEIAKGNWAGLAITTSDLAILHRPDQVAGGYDKFEKLPRPTSDDDTEGWKTYLDGLKKMFGPQVVNSDIGMKNWSKPLIYGQALSDVRKAVPIKMSYPLHRLNLTLIVDKPS